MLANRIRAVSGSFLHYIPKTEYNARMSWEAEYTDEFGAWWQTLSERQQDADDLYDEHLEELRREGLIK